MKTKEPSEEFRAQVSDYVPKKRKRPWSITPEDHVSKVINEPKVETSPNDTFPPKVEKQPKVDFETKVQNKPQVILEPKVISIPEDEIEPQVINQPKELFKPEVKIYPKVELPPKVRNRPQVENSPEIRQHAAMNMLHSHNDQLTTGFTRLPNEIMDQFIKGNFSKQEAQVLAAIIRMTIGFNKEEAPISLGVLKNLTGLQSSRIAGALNDLVEKGLIYRKSGTINSPNVLGLLFSQDRSKMTAKPQVQNEPKVGTIPKVEIKPDASGANETLGLRYESNLQYIQERQIDTLSENKVEIYLNSLPQVKSKKEREALLSLKENYSDGDIEACLSHLQAHGELKTGEPCHSPLSYLSLAMNDVLRKIQEKQKKSRGADDSLERQKKEEIFRAEEQRKEEEAFKLKEKAFLEKFPNDSEQLSQVERLVDGFPVKVGPEIARRIAITRWWEKEKGGSTSG